MSGFVDQNTQLDVNSRILTLSTCNAYDDQRYLVQGVLLNPEAVMPVTDASEISDDSVVQVAP